MLGQGQSWLTKTGVNLKSTESTFQRVPWQAGVRLVLCASQVHEAVLRITSNPLYWYVHTVAYGCIRYVLVCTGMYWCLMVLACWVGMPRSGSDHWLAVAFAYYTWWMISGLALPSVTCRKHEQCFCRDLESEVAVVGDLMPGAKLT